MVDVVNLLQTTLVVMYFVTPAENVKFNDKSKFETTKLWTLQSTNQIVTDNPNMCAAYAQLLVQEFEKVSTITVRAYCLCPPKTVKDDVCEMARDKASPKKRRDVFSSRSDEQPATIIKIAPGIELPSLKAAPP